MGRFFGYGFILQVIALVHFIRRRPENYWLWIIIFFGGLGAAVYIAMEVVPDLGLMQHSMKGFSRRKRIRMLQAMIIDNPSAGNYEELGDILLEEKQYAKARECYDHALAARTDHIDPFYRRGISAFELGDASAALSDFERVVKTDPKYDFSRAQLFYARSLAATGRKEEASAAFEKLLNSSSSTEALLAAAEFYAQQKRTKEARELLERVLARKATMPAYQQRRERPWLRRAASLLKSIRTDVSVAA
ncbi:MAG TPA: tetratricopeptide repeat protein [Thermoanaerobaculia bacterium]|nr:tetratricopeptide repeat protein [Thermoanaerobaculia bacterium]